MYDVASSIVRDELVPGLLPIRTGGSSGPVYGWSWSCLVNNASQSDLINTLHGLGALRFCLAHSLQHHHTSRDGMRVFPAEIPDELLED